ncbi:phage portal protein [Chryseobacterium sediminis]|uniref:Phage portal protein n=1 Tax=Chryseobacterium sediminis TaxID=1679494 RepID=A0A5B2U918_9FLAO|nr:phage portal protein [Chryseobacterium sediminis]KAA2223032.1 phage portal protein [Chryseobacterium sediminis]
MDLKGLDAEEIVKKFDKLRPNTDYLSKAVLQYNVETHEIFTNKTKYPDKLVETEEGTTSQPINRIGFAFQQLIVDKIVAFGFGKPVTYIPTNDSFSLVQDVLKQNKIISLTRDAAREVYGTTKVAEVWYLTPEADRLRVKLLQPTEGDVFYPVFENGDMTAFVREITLKDENDKEVEYREIYTAEEKIVLKKESQWIEESRERNLIGKIPVVYGSQKRTEWDIVQVLIERMEELASGHAETNDYHADPKVKAKGELTGFARKGQKGAIFQMEKDSELDYLTWDNNTESQKLEFDNLKEFVYKLTQTPDISFEKLKSMGAISGVAAQYYFMDIHLKVEMKREIWDDYLARRINVIKAFLANVLSTKDAKKLEELEVDIVYNPYMINDMKEKITYLMDATGGQAIMSVETAMRNLGIDDPVEEMQRIRDENQYSTETENSQTFGV